MQPLFSIIIPCYNSYSLMGKCLDTLEKQTFKEFEVIVVDDCSTDRSYEKLTEWSKTSQLNLKVLKQEKNMGPGAARNLGIEKSCGEYILFIDADDFIELDTMKMLKAVLCVQKPDTIIFDAFMDSKDGSNYLGMVECRNPVEGDISNREAFVYTRGGSLGKVYRRTFIIQNKIYFGEYYRFEDVPFTKSALALSESVYYLRKPLYHYVEVETSIIHSGKDRWDNSRTQKALELVQKHLEGKSFDTEMQAWTMREIYPADLFNKIHNHCSNKAIREYIKKNYPKSSRKNPYIKNYPRSRAIMIRIFISGCIPAIKALYYYKSR